MNNFINLWLYIFTLCYCYSIGKTKIMPKGTPRLLCFLPVVCLLYIPLEISSLYLRFITAFFITWLASFMLVLFTFGRGPLSSPPLSLPVFLAIACLPIKIDKICLQMHEMAIITITNYAIKILLFASLFRIYDYRDRTHPIIVMGLYSFHMYVLLVAVLALVATMARALLDLELEKFNEPYLSTSMQDFWGRRWNIMATSILQATVYEAVRNMAASIFSRRWAPPTWEMTWFFLVHGACLAADCAKEGVREVVIAQGCFYTVDARIPRDCCLLALLPAGFTVQGRAGKALIFLLYWRGNALSNNPSLRVESVGVSHNVYSLSILINCFRQLSRVDFGCSVLGKMLKSGVGPSLVTMSTLINGLCRQSKISQAVSLFDEVVEKGYRPNLIVYNTLLNGLCKIGSTDQAVRLLRMMEGRGFEPDIVAYSTVVDCPCKTGLIKQALDLFSELKVKSIRPVDTVDTMRKQGIAPDVFTMIKLVIEPDVFTYNASMNGHCLGNKVDKARKVFQLMIEKGCADNICSYNTMINGYCKVKRLDEALKLFRKISRKGSISDIATYNTLMQGMFQLGRVSTACGFLRKMLASGQVPDMVTCSILLDGLCKTGKLEEALKLFQAMRNNGSCKAEHIDVAKC
ncbi:hypothetical protein F3Y22_tig00010533pilonHSYRG00286 [Hibiscus syriacus]|uniref:Wax synthase domain-containing protein n=1 Tax=Hibiscus syriacus TaxID=106335 RepID=A0A6A3C997_HIBSY|nr:hypothetical protein F3Y22_tig00010533pilonHSYRG00286 [Hibiscus syriacus]